MVSMRREWRVARSAPRLPTVTRLCLMSLYFVCIIGPSSLHTDIVHKCSDAFHTLGGLSPVHELCSTSEDPKMMAVVPVLMVLYNSDAVEIQYSDGSSLELSPCGSTMVHVGPSERRGHPSSGQLKKLQKRTRFVTSQHRHKVLQALDFRNRFAERSYLCDDLLPENEIVTLFAKIDKIKWPQNIDKANVHLLPDGSLSITSPDEFANLVVSPHGQDFTVCYLSRVSEDNRKSKDLNLANHGVSLKSVDTCALNAKYSSKKNKALIHPFKKSDHLNITHTQLPQDIDESQVIEKGLELKNNWSTSQMKSDHLQIDNLANQEAPSENDISEIDKCKIQEKEVHFQKFVASRPGSHNAEHASAIQSKERCFENPGNQTDVCYFKANLPQEVKKHKASVFFSDACPDPHDISSISRSSTPDGLRTTVESDATLLHDNTSCSFQEQMLVHTKQHSSPTHYTSSPYDKSCGFPLDVPERIARNDDVSLSSSFLCNQEFQSNRITKMAQLVENSNSGIANSLSPMSNYSVSSVAAHGFEQKKSNNNMTDNNCEFPSEIGGSDRVAHSEQRGSSSDFTVSADHTMKQLYIETTSENVPCLPEQDGLGISGNFDQIGKSSDPTVNADSTAKHRISKTTLENAVSFSQRDGSVIAAHFAQKCTGSIPKHGADNSPGKVDFKGVVEYTPCPVKTSSRGESVSMLHGCNMDKCQISTEHIGDRECRERYIWTTKHCSTNDCPAVWIHPLKLALMGADLTNGTMSSTPTQQTARILSSRHPDNESCAFTHVPSPLPVTCPFQHCHKWIPKVSRYNDDDDEEMGTNFGQFQRGKLKIVISEGIVYRLIQRGDLNIIEVYPGDGSILVSQGIKGHFFTHYKVVGDQLEERTYSLKSLPLSLNKAMQSIKHFIETANRLLSINSTWAQQGFKDDVPCWKKEVVAVVEPLSSSLLEECFVEGLGKFSAFTNGRVRIVFEDRTALDMVCNVSRRVQESFKHHQEPLVSLPYVSSVSPPVPSCVSIFGASTGRLMLPSGEYVNVDIKKPGPYRKYIEVAQEWAAWVAAPATERHEFYLHYNTAARLQQAVDLELKKIFCFNYILEQTMLMQQQLMGKGSNPVADSSTPLQAPAADIHPSVTLLPQLPSTGDHSDSLNPHPDPPSTGDHSNSINPCHNPPSAGYHSNSINPHPNPASTGRHRDSVISPPLDSGSTVQNCDLRKFTVSSCPRQLTHSTHTFCNTNLLLTSDQFGTVSHKDGGTDSISASAHKYSQSLFSDNISFESIRQVLLQNSNLINEIDQFLEHNRRV